MERRTTWALPPEAPEAWGGGRWAPGLLTAAVVALVLPVLWLREDTGPAAVWVAVAHATAACAALASTYVLLLQASVSGDHRLRWVAAGYGCLAPLLVLRGQQLGSASLPALGEQDRAGPLTLLALLVVPLWVLTSARAGRGLGRGVLLLDVLAAVVLLVLVLAERLPDTVGDGQEHLPSLRMALVLVALLGVLAASRWRGSTTLAGLARPAGPWAWVWAGVALTSVAAAVSALATARWTPLWWTGLATEVVAAAVPALGLSLVSSSGYRRQRRRWRQLVDEVGQLRAASPLLPGLSVTPEDDDGLPEEHEVQALIDDARVKVALQPVMALGDGEVVGYEALSRFGGRVPTDRWFRGASWCGLGPALERMTLQAALELLAQLPDHVYLAVNVSPAALDDADVLALLTGVDLTRVVVEVTEHEAVPDYRRTRQALEGLRAQGARIAVDDTGAGFSSLRHVLMLQPDIIKLDASLTRDVHGSDRQQSVVLALAGFAREVGSVVLAEGIETEEQLVRLRELGVPYGQGWHLGVPTVVTP